MRRTLQVAVPLATLAVGGSPGLDRFEFTEPHMGTEFRLVFYAETARNAAEAAEAAFDRMAYLDSLFSDYRADSEIARLASTSSPDRIEVSRDLWALLGSAQVWATRTDGAFDVTVGPLTRLWRWSARRGELPERGRLEAARASVGFDLLHVSPHQPSVSFAQSGMSLDLGGIAKGFAADAALEVLVARGYESVLVDAGGDLRLGEAPPGEAGWRIVTPDGETLVLANVGVATSGDRFRFVEVDGVRYSHVVDPRTGLGVRDAPTVSVIGPDAATADALSSAFTVLDVEQSKTLLASLDDVAARIIGSATWTSANFPRPPQRPKPEQVNEAS